MDLLNHMHTTWNIRPTKLVLKKTYQNVDYEMHMGAKLDFLFFQSSFSLQVSKMQLLKNQREQERTQIPHILMLSHENSRPAGYMPTGNQLMFLKIDSGLVWLYHCPLVHSPLNSMNQWYDRIPAPNEGQIQFVDSVTRQTHPAVNMQSCTDRTKMLFQFDKDQEPRGILNPKPQPLRQLLEVPFFQLAVLHNQQAQCLYAIPLTIRHLHDHLKSDRLNRKALQFFTL